MEITTVGIDLAKNVFRLHGCDARGRAVLRKQLGRRQLLAFVARLPSCERRLISLGFLSPRVVEAIVEGRQPPDLIAIALTRRIDLPLLWSAQEQALGLR